jgi:hypothetical protein
MDYKINHKKLDGNDVNKALLDAWLYLRTVKCGTLVTIDGEDIALYRAEKIEKILVENGVITKKMKVRKNSNDKMSQFKSSDRCKKMGKAGISR